MNLFSTIFESFETLGDFLKKHFVESSKALGVLFCGIVLLTIMASNSNVQNIEKLIDYNFHTWKIKMEFSCMHEKEMWEIILGELLLLKVEFGKIAPKGGTLKHCLFIKKDKISSNLFIPKLVCGTIFLNVIDSLLHHVTCAKTTKNAWDNFCATFEKKHVDNKL